MAASNTCEQKFEFSSTSVTFNLEKKLLFISYCHTKHQKQFALSNQFVNES